MTAFPEARNIAPNLGDPNAVAALVKLNRASRYDQSRDPTNTLDRAAELDWISNIASRQFDRISVKSDPNFVLTAEKVKEYNKDLPPAWADEFAGVSSDEEARVLRSQLLQRQRLLGQLSEAGWTGTAARFGANIVDPAALAFGIVSGGAGWISKGGRIARMAKAGLVASAGAVPISAYQTSQDPDGEVADVLYNSAAAFALGSVGHGIGEAISGRWATKTLKELEARELKALPPGEITEKAKIRYADELNADPLRDAIDVETKIAVSESDTHADDFAGLAEAAKNKDLEIVDVDAINQPRTSDIEVDVPGTAEANVGGSTPETAAATPETTTNQARRRFVAVTPELGNVAESAWSSEDFVRDMQDGAYLKKQGNHITVVSGESRSTATIWHTGEGTTGARVIVDPINGERGIKSTEMLLDALRSQGVTHVEFGQTVTKKHIAAIQKLSELGYTVEQNPRIVTESSLGHFIAPKGEASFILSTEKAASKVDVPGTAKVSETGTMGGGTSPPSPPGGSAGQLPPPGGPLSKHVRTPFDFLSNATDSMAAMTHIPGVKIPTRWGIAGRLGASEIPEMRMAASVYAQDSLARKGGKPAPYAGNTWVSTAWRRTIAEIEQESIPHIKAFHERMEVPATKRFAAEEALQKAVSWELEGANISQVAPEIKAIADIHRRKYAELLDVAQRHGVPGFEKVPTNPDYFPHMHNVGAINDAVKEFGLKNIEDLYAKGMIADGWDPVDAVKVAPGYVQALLNLGSYSDLDKIRLFAGDAETLKATFKRFNIGLTDADAERIAKYLSPEDAGVNPRARRRVGLNTMVSSDLTDKNGNARKLFLHQLIETNAQAVMHKYARQILGAAAESEILRDMSLKVDPTGATRFKTFDELRNHIERQYQGRGMLTDRGRGKADLDRLTAIRKALVGIPLNDQSTFSDIARLTRAYNFIRGSGTFGIAQSVEFGKIAGEFGMEPIIQQWPALKQLFSRAQNGELTNETLREVLAITAGGTERITNQITARFDDQIGIEEFGGKGLETALRRGEKFAGDVSMLVPITIAQQRMASLAAGQKILNLAKSGRPLSTRRLADIGLDQPMWSRIVDQVKQHAGTDGSRLRTLNLDNWTDTEAAAHLVSGMDRWVRRAVQDSDIGSMSLWMTKPIGRMIIQFRSFALQSWEKQTLRTIQVRDARAFLGWAFTGALGALAFVGQQYARSLTDNDSKKSLKKNLSLKNIAAQGFARSGASSILPSVVDTTGSFFGADPLFQSRYSGLSSRGLMSNPTFDLFDSGNQFARGLGRVMTGGSMTRGEARAGTKLLPFQNVVGIRNALDAVTDGLPKDKK